MQLHTERPRSYSAPGILRGRGRELVVRASLLDLPARERIRERAQAAGLGMGLIGSIAASRGAALLPTPWSNAACVAWFDAAATQALTVMYHSAGSGPAVTITGSQSVWSPVGIRVEVTTGGSSGGQFRVFYDSGTTPAHSAVAIPYGSTYALDGAAAGFTLGFPSGTYVTSDVYEGAATSAASLKTGTDALTGSGAGAPRLLVGTSGILGRASWKGDGTATTLDNAGITWPSIATKSFLYGVASPIAVGAGAGIIAGGTHATAGPHIRLSATTTVTGYNGGNVACSGVVLGTPKRFVLALTGNVNDRVIWGSTTQTGTLGNTATGALGFDLFSQNAAASTFFSGLISCCGLFSGDPATGGLLTALDAWLTASVGGAGFTGGAALTS